MGGTAFWKAFGWTNLIFSINILPMIVRVPIPHHLDAFMIFIPLAELVILIGVAIWQGLKNSGATVTGIFLGIVLQGGIWFMFILFLGLLGGLGDSRQNVDYFAKP